MMKNLAIGLFLALSIATAHAQLPDSVWHIVNSGIPAGLSTMTWTSNDTGFFLGSASDLFLTRTPDGGTTFSKFNFPDSIVTISGAKSRYLTFEQITGGMSWPSPATGFVAGITTSDTFGHSARPTIIKTTDAGATWKQYYPSDTLINFSNIYFPADRVGFASATRQDSNVISTTGDSGKTWTNIYGSNDLVFEKLNFFNAKNGMIFAVSNTDGSNHLLYTTDGGTSFHSVALPSGSSRTALHWNADGSWLIAIDSSIYRSTDSGKTSWTRVVSPDTNGDIQTMAIRDSMGFAFRSDEPVVLSTRDYGMTWKSDTLPHFANNVVQAVSTSMPSDSEAYLLATDPQSDNLLLKIVIPPPAPSGNGAVAMAPLETTQFSAAMEGNEILFTATSADRARSIDVMDVLGRVCAVLPLQAGATTSQLSSASLPAGSYFAQLGGAIVKFTVWN